MHYIKGTVVSSLKACDEGGFEIRDVKLIFSDVRWSDQYNNKRNNPNFCLCFSLKKVHFHSENVNNLSIHIQPEISKEKYISTTLSQLINTLQTRKYTKHVTDRILFKLCISGFSHLIVKG